MIRVGLAVLVIGLGLILMPGEDAPEAAAHWDSEPTDVGYIETIEMRAVPVAPLEDLAVTVDGQLVDVIWVDDDGLLGRGDQVVFPLDEMDAPRVLEILRGGDVLVQFTFGSGAGTPI